MLHINVLELKAALLGIKALCSEFKSCHIQVQIDNTTAVSYINNKGGTHSQTCNVLAKELILWCKERSIWLSACHIPWVDNSNADSLSRKLNEDIEWMLNPDIFTKICRKFGTPDTDLFASRINHQLCSFFSYHPDCNAKAVNAFSHKWDMFAYIFPPFCVISRVLRKLQEDKTQKALLVVPFWPVIMIIIKLYFFSASSYKEAQSALHSQNVHII